MIELEFFITELNRRLENAIRIGRVDSVDLTKTPPKVRVKVGELVTAELPFLALRAGEDKSWWPITVGEQVIILSPGGSLNRGVVIGSLFQNDYPQATSLENVVRTDYSDGAITEYDKENHVMKITLPTDGTLEIVASGGVTITGDLTVNGNIAASNNISDATRSMVDDRGIYNTHKHPGVTSGTSTTAVTAETQ